MAKATTGKLELRPHHCGIYVPDIEKAIVWYHDMLGFTVAKRMTIAAIPAKVAFLKRGNFYIELFEVEGTVPAPKDTKTIGTKHMAFMVDNLCQAVETLKKCGVEIERDMSDGRAGPRAVFIRDNSGILIELVPPEAPE